MFGNEFTIGALLTYKDNELFRKNEIQGWGEYGVVAPSLWTTNGSIDFLADRLYEKLNFCNDAKEFGFRYVLEGVGLEGVDQTNRDALRQWLSDQWHRGVGK